jgi:hypothetical protein
MRSNLAVVNLVKDDGGGDSFAFISNSTIMHASHMTRRLGGRLLGSTVRPLASSPKYVSFRRRLNTES